ncbi:hypothetical protein BLNAU_1651 [Blattamonas nauphoetae]|uniref:MARVEL domain-containing protein n=1 Tax=Blattamonas nauphoetae TaxID=2049346 RepID=A0ABQ9YH77_9EUKA|nr:hypothetical protein BLNAU_1651 [Blattamonas nauphoetae]
MSSVVVGAAKHQVKKITGSVKKSQFNWENYNFPPKLKIIHLSPAEFDEGHRKGIYFTIISASACLFLSVFNMITNIIATCLGTYGHWKWLILSIVNIIAFALGYLFLLNKSFKFAANVAGPLVFGISFGAAGLICFCYMLFPWIFFHGFLTPTLKTRQTGFFRVISIIEGILWFLDLAAFGLTAFFLVKDRQHHANKRDNTE